VEHSGYQNGFWGENNHWEAVTAGRFSKVFPYINQSSVPNNVVQTFGKITKPNAVVMPENPLPAEKGKVISQGGLTMLVLSRKRGETITIGNGVTVTVLAVQGDRVKIGVMAPAEVPVHRQEIHERIGVCSSVMEYAEIS
jgi:carbon storage regulator